MRVFLAVIFLFVNSISFSQTIEELEYELSFYKSGEKWGDKKEYAYKLLELDGLNEQAINYLVEVFGRSNQRESIAELFDQLARQYPDNPEVYLIRVRGRNAHFAGLTYTEQINYLKKAKELDNSNKEAIYNLGSKYYELFVREFNNNQKEANLNHYAINSIQYFTQLIEQDDTFKETLRFPLIQLSNFTNDSDKFSIYNNYSKQSSYFPISAFLVLPNDWKTNYSVDVLSFVSGHDTTYYGVEYSVFSMNWYSRHLKALDEPVINDSIPGQVFRFTWLRTFDNPVVVRIENNENIVRLYWKVSDGEGGYDPGEVIENKSKELTISDWEKFLELINEIDFWNFQSVLTEVFGTDGSQWILEGHASGQYHVVDRWSGGGISSVCLALLKMTDLNIGELEIY